MEKTTALVLMYSIIAAAVMNITFIDKRSERHGRACSDMTEQAQSPKGLIPRGLPRL
jgi:hypothetical protein